MQEELFISGRDIPHIDPVLEIWHWPIAVYLFLGGLSAGILFFAAVTTLMGKQDEYPDVVKRAMVIPPIALSLGLIALVIDLKHPLYFWQLYMTIRIQSPMSWGAWVLLIVTPLSFLWVMSYWSELFPKWRVNWSLLDTVEGFLRDNRKYLAMALVPLSIVLGIYTGILLSAFNARPLWNNAILGPLFLISGMSTGAAAIILMAKTHKQKSLFSKIDILLIVIELGLIIHMLMGMYAGSEVQLEAMRLLVGGEFTLMFFGFVVIFGLLVPGFLEVSEIFGYKIPVAIPALMILIGGLVFRFLMIEAGQITRYLY